MPLACREGRRFVVIDCKVDVFCMCDFWEMIDKPLFSKMFMYDMSNQTAHASFVTFRPFSKKLSDYGDVLAIERRSCYVTLPW